MTIPPAHKDTTIERFNAAMISGQTSNMPEQNVGVCFTAYQLEQRDAAIRNATLDEMVAYHKDMARLHTPKNGAVSIVSIRSAVIQHEKSIEKIERLRSQKEQP